MKRKDSQGDRIGILCAGPCPEYSPARQAQVKRAGQRAGAIDEQVGMRKITIVAALKP
jgi:hypothetical protein